MFKNTLINVDHHNYTKQFMVVAGLTPNQIHNLIMGLRFYENVYDHPKVDAYDDDGMPTITNQDCQLFYFDSKGVGYLHDHHNENLRWLIATPDKTNWLDDSKYSPIIQ